MYPLNHSENIGVQYARDFGHFVSEYLVTNHGDMKLVYLFQLLMKKYSWFSTRLFQFWKKEIVEFFVCEIPIWEYLFLNQITLG